MNNKTLLNLVIREFKTMIASKMNFAPTADQIQATAKVWCETIHDEFHMPDETEVPRIAVAFRALRKEHNLWPTPSDLLKALPPYPRRYHLAEPPPSGEECERGKAAIENIVNNIIGRE